MQDFDHQPVRNKNKTFIIILFTTVISITLTVLVDSYIRGFYTYNMYYTNNPRTGLEKDCKEAASVAQTYYMNHWIPGEKGTKRSFKDFAPPIDYRETANGKLQFEFINDNELRITATGNTNGNDKTTPAKIRMSVLPDRYKSTILN